MTRSQQGKISIPCPRKDKLSSMKNLPQRKSKEHYSNQVRQRIIVGSILIPIADPDGVMES